MEDLQKMMQMRRTKMLNIEKYKNEIAECKKRCELGHLIRVLTEESFCKQFNPECGKCEESMIKWLFSEYKEPILDDVEKAYLSAVIKPFRKRIKHITIVETVDNSKQFVRIDLYDGDYASFPNFKANTMYKGMKPRKHYSLEELGL